MWISKHVWFFRREKGPSSNASVILDKKQILIDPGTNSNGNLEELFCEMRKDGIKPESTQEIRMTHFHVDHVACIGELSHILRCLVRGHSLAKKIAISHSPYSAYISNEMSILDNLIEMGDPREKVIWSKIRWIFKIWMKKIVKEIAHDWKPIAIDRWLSFSRVEENGIRILHLPGHTPDELGFWMEKEKILIGGDLITETDREFLPVVNVPSSSLNDALCSLEKIEELRPRVWLPGHGDPIQENEVSDVIERARKISRKYKDKALFFWKSFSSIQAMKKLWQALPKTLSSRERFVLCHVILKALKEENLI